MKFFPDISNLHHYLGSEFSRQYGCCMRKFSRLRQPLLMLLSKTTLVFFFFLLVFMFSIVIDKMEDKTHMCVCAYIRQGGGTFHSTKTAVYRFPTRRRRRGRCCTGSVVAIKRRNHRLKTRRQSKG